MEALTNHQLKQKVQALVRMYPDYKMSVEFNSTPTADMAWVDVHLTNPVDGATEYYCLPVRC